MTDDWIVEFDATICDCMRPKSNKKLTSNVILSAAVTGRSGVTAQSKDPYVLLRTLSSIGTRESSSIRPPPAVTATEAEPKQATTMPGGYYFDLGSAESIPPGKSLLFSVPVSHLSKSWHMEIPYEFDLPSGKGPRPEMIGGLPSMVLEYSAWDLPEAVQQKLNLQ